MVRLPSELKNEDSLRPGKPSTLKTPFPATATSSSASAGTMVAEAAASTAVAAGAAGTPDPEGFAHEAATICATPMLLQFRRALMLSWRTKFGGKRKISDDKP